MSQNTYANIEQWRPVPGYEGLYEISNRGTIISLRRNSVLKPWEHYRGGLRVKLTDAEGHCKMRQIHRLVVEAFVGPIPDKHVVRHLNDDARDNRVENLAIGTYQDNTNDMIRLHGHYKAATTHCPAGHPLCEGNLVAGQLKRGYRSCLSCDRARLEFKRHPERGEFQELSDRRFQKLIDDGIVSHVVGLHWLGSKN